MPWTFPYLGETKELNEATRANVPGSFVQLSDGYTHYELGGPENGQPVVLVHGFSVPYFIWDPTFAFLAKSGFRVLRYDLFGRGYSDRPKLRYDIDLFCKQLRELLDTLGFETDQLDGSLDGRADHSYFHSAVSGASKQAGFGRPCRSKTCHILTHSQSSDNARVRRAGSRSVWTRADGKRMSNPISMIRRMLRPSSKSIWSR